MAERKLLQLRLASACGFAVPKTLVSNSPDAIHEFVRDVGGQVVAKPVSHGFIAAGDASRAIFTTRLDMAELLSAHDLSVAPTMFQEEIVRGDDLRVTCIGSRIRTVRVSFDAAVHVDWRHPAAMTRYDVASLSNVEEERCLSVMRSLNLQFAAFDFIRRPDGSLVFLELNPTGEWAWLEKEAGVPIRDDLADLLSSTNLEVR